MKNEVLNKAFDSWEVLIHPFEVRLILPREVSLKVERFKARSWTEDGKTFVEWQGSFVEFVVITDYLIEMLDEALSEEVEVRVITQGRVKYWEGLSQCAVWALLWEILKS